MTDDRDDSDVDRQGVADSSTGATPEAADSSGGGASEDEGVDENAVPAADSTAETADEESPAEPGGAVNTGDEPGASDAGATSQRDSASTSAGEGDSDGLLAGGLPVSRRNVLGGAAVGLGSGTLGYLLGSGFSPSDLRGDGEDGVVSGTDADEHLPFDVWEEMQHGLRTSPDHLPGRATTLVDWANERHERRAAAVDDDGVTARVAEESTSDDEGVSSITVGAGSSDGHRFYGGTATLRSPGAVTDDEIEEDGDDETPSDTVGDDEPDPDLGPVVDDVDILEALFEFVRDGIQTVPTSRSDIDDVAEVLRWGGRGALRCGMGTPRDKAEALANLYHQAGYSATVRETRVDREEQGLTAEEIRTQWLQTPAVEDEPDITDEQLEAWADRLEREPAEDMTVVDEGGGDSLALADSLRDLLPAEPSESRNGPSEFDWRWNSARSSSQSIPVVEVFDDDQNRYYANLFGDVPFGEIGDDNRIEEPETDVETVRVTLSAATSNTIEEPFELVSGEWAVPDLVGRQLLVRTPTLTDPVEFPTVGIDDMNMFTPSLTLQGPDMTDAEQAELSEFGDMITLSGDRLSADFEFKDGEVVFSSERIMKDGQVFFDPDDVPDLETIESVEVDADSTNYPRIRLEATVLDSSGDHVAGLPGPVFSATDEGQIVHPSLVDTRPVPKILYVIDDSGSMGRGVDAATDDEKYDELEALMVEMAPGATIERRYVDSAMWTHLPDAIADNPDLIVFAHDGQPANAYDERADPLFEVAPRTVLLSAYDESAPVEDEVVLHQAELTGATVTPMGDWELLRERVADAVVDVVDSVPTYRFDYHVPDDGLGTREVELSIGAEPDREAETTGDDTDADVGNDGNEETEPPEVTAVAEATTNYETSGSTGVIRSLVGLYLTVEYDGRSVTRTLGGWDPLQDDSWDPYSDDPDEETGFGMPGLVDFARDTKMAMLGGVDISFEGDGVPLSVLLDDMMQARHSYRELHALVEEIGADASGEMTDEEFHELLAVYKRGRMEVAWDPLFVQTPLPNRQNEDGLTYFLGPRTVAYQVKPVIENGNLDLEESLDILPISRATTATEDPDEGFYRTLERTARMSIMEDARFDSSTLSLLEGSALADTDDLDEYEADRDQYEDLRRHAGLDRRSYQLAPRDGSSYAMWNVNRRTGTLLGIMPDGTGGAVRRRRLASMQDRDRAEAALDLYLDVLEEANLLSKTGGAALGVVAAYYAHLADLYAKVTAIVGSISGGDPSTGPGMAGLGGVAGGTASDVIRDAAEDQIPGSDWVSRFANMATIAGFP
ncbi:hypothetical protein ACLI4R_06640 [Natrialbaceae archaeon A-chndr2]